MAPRSKPDEGKEVTEDPGTENSTEAEAEREALAAGTTTDDTEAARTAEAEATDPADAAASEVLADADAAPDSGEPSENPVVGGADDAGTSPTGPGDGLGADMSGMTGPAEPVAVSTANRLVALRSRPEHDAPEVGVPVGGQLAPETVWAELILAGSVTPTFQLVASEGLVVNPADLAALPPRSEA